MIPSTHFLCFYIFVLKNNLQAEMRPKCKSLIFFFTKVVDKNQTMLIDDIIKYKWMLFLGSEQLPGSGSGSESFAVNVKQTYSWVSFFHVIYHCRLGIMWLCSRQWECPIIAEGRTIYFVFSLRRMGFSSYTNIISVIN